MEPETKRSAATLEDIKVKGMPIDKSNKLLNENTTPERLKGLSISETVKAKTVETERENPDWDSLFRSIRSSSEYGYCHDHAKCLEERERMRYGWYWEEDEMDYDGEDPSPWGRSETLTSEDETSEDEDDTDAERVMPKGGDDVMVA